MMMTINECTLIYPEYFIYFPYLTFAFLLSS